MWYQTHHFIFARRIFLCNVVEDYISNLISCLKINFVTKNEYQSITITDEKSQYLTNKKSEICFVFKRLLLSNLF